MLMSAVRERSHKRRAKRGLIAHFATPGTGVCVVRLNRLSPLLLLQYMRTYTRDSGKDLLSLGRIGFTLRSAYSDGMAERPERRRGPGTRSERERESKPNRQSGYGFRNPLQSFDDHNHPNGLSAPA